MKAMGWASAAGATLTLAALWLWLGWLDYSRLALIGAGVASLPLLGVVAAGVPARVVRHIGDADRVEIPVL